MEKEPGKTTMNKLYGDGSNHLACEKCELCLTCKDCARKVDKLTDKK